MHCFATAFAKSFTVSVFPVPAGPVGAAPRLRARVVVRERKARSVRGVRIKREVLPRYLGESKNNNNNKNLLQNEHLQILLLYIHFAKLLLECYYGIIKKHSQYLVWKLIINFLFFFFLKITVVERSLNHLFYYSYVFSFSFFLLFFYFFFWYSYP